MPDYDRSLIPPDPKTGTFSVTVTQTREVTFELETNENDLDLDAIAQAIMQDDWDDITTSVTFHEFVDGFTPRKDDE